MQPVQADEPTVLCLGNFDGVHLGHRRLVSAVIERRNALRAEYADIKTGAWFFREAPTGKALPRLTTLAEKLAVFASLGLDYAFLADFSALKHLSPTDFVENILKRECHCIHAVCGFNFRFGEGASGTASELVGLMRGHADIVAPVTDGGMPVSSSLIRGYLLEGKAEDAARLLGRSFSLETKVVRGKSLGHTMGMPTANQLFPDGIIHPASGVYATLAYIDGIPFAAVSNVGVRPSFDDGNHVNCETHIIGHSCDLYGKTLRVEFYRRLRSEICFSSHEQLLCQIKKDIEEAKAYFKKKGGVRL